MRKDGKRTSEKIWTKKKGHPEFGEKESKATIQRTIKPKYGSLKRLKYK